MKEYKIVINNQEFIIKQDYDGKFIKPDFIKEYEKVGSALKPSFEPIIVARKPFKGSLVDNVIEYGVGGINIDDCRVETNDIIKPAISGGSVGLGEMIKGHEYTPNNLGRFPANTILTYDENDFDEVCGGFPKDNKGQSNARYFYCAKASAKDRNEGLDVEIEEYALKEDTPQEIKLKIEALYEK